MKWKINSRFPIFPSPIVFWSFVLNGPLSFGFGCIPSCAVGGHTHFITDFSSRFLFHFLLLELQNEILFFPYFCFVYRRSHSLDATYVPRMCNFFPMYLILLDEYRMRFVGLNYAFDIGGDFFTLGFRTTFHHLTNEWLSGTRRDHTVYCVGCVVERNATNAPGKMPGALCT